MGEKDAGIRSVGLTTPLLLAHVVFSVCRKTTAGATLVELMAQLVQLSLLRCCSMPADARGPVRKGAPFFFGGEDAYFRSKNKRASWPH